MNIKFIALILASSLLLGCGAQGGAEDDPAPIGNNPSSSGVITSTSSVAPSSLASSSQSQLVSSSSQLSMPTSSSPRSSSARSSSSRSSSVATSSVQSSLVIASSSRSSSSRSSSSRSSSSSTATQQVTIQWSHPTQRENGAFLELSEIGGYDIRVRPANSTSFSSYPIPGNQTTSYVLNNYSNTMIVEIAVYDTDGIYSQFVTVSN